MNFDERIDAMKVTVRSPDGRVQARLTGGKYLEVGFARGAYHDYDEALLEHQLSQLAKLLWTGYQRGFDQAVDEATGGRAGRSDEEHWDANERRFATEVSKLVAKGVSPGNCVKAETEGMRNWRVRIRDGTLDRLDEQTFGEEVAALAQAVISDYRGGVATARQRYFY